MALLNGFNVRTTGLEYEGYNSIADVYNEPYVTPGWFNSQYGLEIIEQDPYGDVYGLGLGLDLDFDSGLGSNTEPEPEQRKTLFEDKETLGIILAVIIGLLLIT